MSKRDIRCCERRPAHRRPQARAQGALATPSHAAAPAASAAGHATPASASAPKGATQTANGAAAVGTPNGGAASSVAVSGFGGVASRTAAAHCGLGATVRASCAVCLLLLLKKYLRLSYDVAPERIVQWVAGGAGRSLS